MYLNSSKENNPLYENIPIAQLAPERLNNEKLISTRKNAKFTKDSERRTPNRSASLPNAKENSLTSMRNRAQRKECYYLDQENSFLENVCIGEWSPKIVDSKTLRSKRKTPNLQAALELGEGSGSVSTSFRKDTNRTHIAYMPQQMHMHSSDEDSPLYGNISIEESTPECLKNEQLLFSRNTYKFHDRSEWENLKCSASLHGGEENRKGRENSNCSASLRKAEENSTSFVKNQAQREKCYYLDEEHSIFGNICIREWSPEIVDYETLLSKRKNPNLLAALELGEGSGSVSTSFGEGTNRTHMAYMPQQLHMHSSDEDSLLYGNISIEESTPECLKSEQILFSRNTYKFQDRSEWENPNCSASLHDGEESNSLYVRNWAQQKECYDSDEENSIFENVSIGEWSPEIVDYETLRSKRKNSKSQTSKDLREPTCSMSFENIQPDSIRVLRVILPSKSLTPTGCKLDEETEPHSRRHFMDNRKTLPNAPPHTTGMSLPRLRLGRRFRVIRNKVAKLFNRKKCHSPRQLGPGTGIVGRLDNGRQFVRIFPSRGFNRCRESGSHSSRPG
ncbi:hypothetical protein NPIL_565261 [Nephila pilipes]|uniref:Uncharacterized protein n=1 Tax=Nephila pilipes TaxID=299642 RepID=A0A8X6UFT6_NEPPI|nr:hypothetical protein NPIL_565261 [Nephila pilipes]